MIQPIHLHMVHAQIGRTKIFIIPRHFHAINMGPEIPFRNAPQAFMKYLICDSSRLSILSQTKHRYFAVMISGYKKIFILIIR